MARDGDRWNAEQYLKFSGPRFRPGLDLLAQAPIADPASIVDLGCGTGDLTLAIQARFPKARITGMDNSPDMLAKARRHGADIDWVEADLMRWTPATTVDLLYSNAVLQWIPDHSTVLRHVAGMVNATGGLAIQMPRNFNAPSHVLARETAAGPRWKDRIGSALLRDPVADPDVYYRLLGDLGFSHIDIWETEYLHVLEGDDPVLEWVKGTALTPVFALIDGAERADFVAEYGAALRAAYPKKPDGKTLFPFRRIFLTARR